MNCTDFGFPYRVSAIFSANSRVARKEIEKKRRLSDCVDGQD